MTTSASGAEVGEETTSYETFAPHYDAFTDHRGYAEWICRLEALARRHGLHGKLALDVGCGTGKSVLPLLDLGYDVVGCDPSAGMLEQARRKTNGTVQLVHASAEALPHLGRFDYITCVNDVCNYIADPERLGEAFGRVAANLAPDGVFVFDANTPATYRGFFTQTHWRENDGQKFVWHGPKPDSFQPNAQIEATIEIFEPSGELWRHTTSRHLQRHYDEATVAELLESAGLRVSAVYGQTDPGTPEQPVEPDRHTKALYVVVPRPGSSC